MPVLQCPPLARLDGSEHLTIDPVAIDGVTRDALPKLRDGTEGHVPDAARVLRADQGSELVLLGGQPIDDLATRAPGGAPADASRFEHRHAITSLGQRQRRRATRDARTDHAHVGPRVALQRRCGRGR